MFSFVTRFVLFVVCLFALPAAATVFAKGLGIVFSDGSIWIPFLCGLIPGAAVYAFLRRLRFFQIFEVFEHELTHAIVALLFLKKIRRFAVTAYEGGAVEFSGGFGGSFGDEMIGLAPYYLPTFSFISAWGYAALRSWSYLYLHVWIGLTLAYHTLSTLNELRENWTKSAFREAGSTKLIRSDIGRVGYVYSAAVIITFTLILHSLIFWLMGRGIPSLEQWWYIFSRATAAVIVIVIYYCAKALEMFKG